MQGKHILIVEDDDAMQELIQDYLESLGYRTSVAGNGVEALECLKKEIPDLITLDVMMPLMPGLEFLAIIKKDDKYKQIPVIVVSALAERNDCIKGLAAGAEDYIVKPFHIKELTTRIKIHLKMQDLLHEKDNYITELSSLNQVKNELIGMAAHDLRTPFMAIRGLCELILNYPIEPERLNYFIEKIDKMSNGALNLINDLLDINKIESGAINLKCIDIPVENLLTRIISDMEDLARAKEMNLLSEIEENLPKLNVDPNRIHEIFINLVSNAIKYSNTGAQIIIKAIKKNDYIHFTVSDEGQGIPQDEIDKLFIPFSKTSVKTTGGEASTGLGLAIVKKLVEMHYGEVWVNSEVDKGSTFGFKIPI